ncbi:ATP-binding protein [Zoogloea sp. LCSB751]|uniref:hybrid sensor histidine kinase/response regulator n=1 Tax=Zoogloea sp. LCSB751 TaxID=1965277 RepID=UPI001117A18A|nr:ATP-binding protein [Zoogloea sp. LCSB751]
MKPSSPLPVRKRISLLFSLLTAIGVSMALVGLYFGLGSWRDAMHVAAHNTIATHSLAAVKHFAFERGRTNVILRGRAPISDANRAFIDERRANGDAAIATALESATHLPHEADDVDRDWAAIKILRQEVERNFALPLAERDPGLLGRWLEASNRLVAHLEILLAHASRVSEADFVFTQLASMRIHALQFRNAVGSESTLLAGELAANRIPDAHIQRKTALLRGASQQSWQHIEDASGSLNDPSFQAAKDKVRRIFFADFLPLMDGVLDSARQGHLPELTVDTYAQKSVPALDSIIEMVDSTDRMVGDYVHQQLERARWLLAGALGGLTLTLLLACLARRVLKRDLILPLHTIVDRLYRLRGVTDRMPPHDADDLANINHALNLLEDSLLEVQAARIAAETNRSQLSEAKERLEAAASAGIVGVWDWDIPKDRLIWDKVMYQLYGLREEDFGEAYEAWARAIHPEDRPYTENEIQAALRGEREYAPQFRVVWPDGSVRYIQAMSHTSFDDQGRPVRMIGVNYDLTEQKKIELALEQRVAERTEELNKAKELAEAASRAKSTFLANMSHELRTPMNAIMGMANIMLRRVQEPKLRVQIEKIDVASRHLLHVINDILDLSKIEAERLILERIEFRVGDTVENLMALIGPKATEKGLDFRIDLPAEVARRALLGDPTRLGQILLNLSGNAVKFTDRGTITLRCRCAAEDDDRLQLRWDIVDTGIGISTDDLKRLFTAFEQADGSLTRKYGGTGLGLAISKRLVQLMGGDIGVDSELGQGSRFWFTTWLPKADEHTPYRSPAPALRSTEQRLLDEHAGSRILLAEDEPVNQEVSREMLEDVGFHVDVAPDGNKALALAHQNRYALILMDMQMPNMNGVDATKAIRSPHTGTLNTDTPILAMTANAFEEDRQLCFAAGMNDFVSKPVAPDTLYQVMLKWLKK